MYDIWCIDKMFKEHERLNVGSGLFKFQHMCVGSYIENMCVRFNFLYIFLGLFLLVELCLNVITKTKQKRGVWMKFEAFTDYYFIFVQNVLASNLCTDGFTIIQIHTHI